MSRFIEALTFHNTGHRVPQQHNYLSVFVKQVPPEIRFDVLDTYEAELVWRARVNTTPEGKARAIHSLSEQLRWEVYSELYGMIRELSSAVYGGDTETSLEIMARMKEEVGLRR